MGIGIGSGCGIGIGIAQSSPERILPPQFRTVWAASSHTAGAEPFRSASILAVAAESTGEPGRALRMLNTMGRMIIGASRLE